MTTTVMYPELKLHKKSRTLASMTLMKALGLLGAGLVISSIGCTGVWLINYYFEQRTCRAWDIDFEDNSWFLFMRDQSRAGVEWPENDRITIPNAYGNIQVQTLG